MSFNPTIKAESKNENQKTQTNVSDQQIITYQGRYVAYPITFREEQQLISMNLNFADRILLRMQNIMGVDLTKLPGSFLVMARKMMQLIDEKPSQSVTTFFGFKIEMPIEVQIKVEEEQQARHKNLICMLEDQMDLLKLVRQKQLQFAWVSSPEELQKKEMVIRSYKIKAEERYLHDSTNLATRKEIDKALIIAYKGTLNDKDQKTIEDYWTLVSKGAEGAEKVKAITDRSNQLFVKGVFDSQAKLFERFEKMAEEGKKINQYEILINLLQDLLNETRYNLTEERSSCTNPEEAVYLDYLMLTGSYQMPTIINSMLRKALQPQLQKAQERLEKGVEFAKKDNQKAINLLECFIQDTEKGILRDEQDLEELTPECRQVMEKCIEMQRKDISDAREKIRKYQAYSEKDFEKIACQLFNLVHPKEIKASIPKETSFDVLYQQIMDVETQGQAAQIFNGSMFTVSADMCLDLATIENPDEHFYNKLQHIDRQKLSLLKPTDIEEIV